MKSKYKPRILEIRIYEKDKLICGTNAGVSPKLSDLTIFDAVKASIFIMQDLRRKEDKKKVRRKLRN